MTIGCDFHTRYQQIAMLDDATGELTERRAGGRVAHEFEAPSRNRTRSNLPSPTKTVPHALRISKHAEFLQPQLSYACSPRGTSTYIDN